MNPSFTRNSNITFMSGMWLTSILVLLLFSFQPGYSQSASSLVYRATGTGRTTGHIITLTISNPTENDATIDSGPFYVPPTGEYQPYIIPYGEPVTVPAGEQVTLPLSGYCTDVHKPPVPSGNDVLPFDEWIRPGLLTNDWIPSLDSGWEPDGNIQVTIPGTDRLLGHRLDEESAPDQAGLIYLEAIRLIEEVVDEGGFSTPFSGNPEKEREAIIQQTFWIFTTAVRGETYEKPDFAQSTYNQFETSTQRPVASLPQKDKDKLDQGIDDFWNTFQAVGAEAKILPRQPSDDYVLINASSSRPQCQCDSLKLEILLFEGSECVDTIPVHTDKVSSTASLKPDISHEVASGDSLELVIRNIQFYCHCPDAGACNPYPMKKTGGPDTTGTSSGTIEWGENDADASNDNFHCQRLDRESNGWNEDGDAYSMKIGFSRFGRRDDNPYQCFQVKVWCVQSDCRRKRCAVKVCLPFRWE